MNRGEDRESSRISAWWQRLQEYLKPMTPGERAGYLLHYYKGWIIGFLILLLFIGYFVDASVQGHKETLLEGFFLNDEHSLFDAETIESEYGDRIGLGKNQKLILDDSLYISLDGDATEYTAASKGKIVAYMSTAELDFIVTPQSLYDSYFLGNFPMLDLRKVLSDDQRERLSPYIVMGTDGDGNEAPVALNLSGTGYLEGQDIETEGEYLLFVPYLAPHLNQISDFIDYLYSVA